MKVLFYSIKDFERAFIKTAAPETFELHYTKEALSKTTASLAKGFDAVSIFSADDATEPVIRELKENGVSYIAVRASGYDNVDISVANETGIRVANVPGYSPNAVAEHAVALLLALNRKLIKANEQVHRQNFSVDNLVGFDLYKKKVGIIGTGRIGRTVAKIMHGFGCTLLAYDVKRDQELEHRYNVFYTGLHTLCSMSDIITLHIPLTDKTHYLIDRKLIHTMKRGVILINTARGGVVNTQDVLNALPGGEIGGFGADVYENEKGVFFSDHTGEDLKDPLLKKLLNFSNVLITPHQAFATQEALKNIAETTFANLHGFKHGKPVENEITYVASMI
jgi:D-lactate dehydrogenase